MKTITLEIKELNETVKACYGRMEPKLVKGGMVNVVKNDSKYDGIVVDMEDNFELFPDMPEIYAEDLACLGEMPEWCLILDISDPDTDVEDEVIKFC